METAHPETWDHRLIAMGLHVLITSLDLGLPTGSTLYVRDLALELQRQGCRPAVFTLTKGPVADELARAGIVVTNTLEGLRDRPDVIHGHHLATGLAPVPQLPGVPAISVHHTHEGWHDAVVRHPRIRRYFGVSAVCVRRVIRDGVPAVEVGLLPNFVDTRRFLPRPPLPERPRRALVFSNHAHETTQLPAVREACRRAGLELDVVGARAGRLADRPEELLGEYDIVFAKGRAAIEAMAVGAAVVLCDLVGVGPMVTSGEVGALQAMNFGFETLRDPLRPEPLLREIARYDALDAARVRDEVRARASLEGAVRTLLKIYHEVIAEQAAAAPCSEEKAAYAPRRVRLFITLARAWRSAPPWGKNVLRRLPGGEALLSATIRRLVARP